jgi:large subunit ribosomal protein L13
MSVRTYIPKVSEIEREWFIVDAEGKTLGRIATQIATIIRGKHKPTYTPNIDVGDFVIVINAEKVRLTGNKENQKNYYRHSNYPGGLTTTSFRRMIDTHPERVIEYAVKGMLPGNTLAKQQLLKLKVYAGPDHPHAAQQPKALEV